MFKLASLLVIYKIVNSNTIDDFKLKDLSVGKGLVAGVNRVSFDT